MSPICRETRATMLVFTYFLVIASCFPMSSDPVTYGNLQYKQDGYSKENYGKSGKYIGNDLIENRYRRSFNKFEDMLAYMMHGRIFGGFNIDHFTQNHHHGGKVDTNDQRELEKIGKWFGFQQEQHDEDRNEIIYEKYGGCHDFPAFNHNPLYMVDKCPRDFENTAVILLCRLQSIVDGNKCIIDIDNIPVQDVDGIVYRNIHCSYCHRARNVSAWTAYMMFDELSALKLVDGFKSIKLLKNLGDSANCTKKIYPYNHNAIMHCNPNKQNDTEEGKDLRSRDTPVDFPPQKATPVVPLSFQIIINFGINGQGHIIFNTEPIHQTEVFKCQRNEVYYKGMCRKVSCDEGYELVDYSCQPKTTLETDDPQDTITTLKHIHQMSWITLRLNVSFDDLILFNQVGAEQMLIENIAHVFNLSSSRITNFTIALGNNSASSKTFEVKPLASYEKTMIKPKENIQNLSEKMKVEEITSSNDDLKNDKDEENEISPEAKSEFYQSEFQESQKLPYEFENGSLLAFSVDHRFSVELKFALLAPAKKSSKENQLDNIVDAMNDLIVSKSFNLALNGTDFHVYNLTKANSKYIVDHWCSNPEHGEFKYMHGETEFVVVTYQDKRTEKYVKGIYVNETGKYYGPDMYDLYIEVSGELGNITNVTASGMVFVCDRPRIEDGKCVKITLNSSEYQKQEDQTILFKGEVFGLDKYEYINYTGDDIRLCVYNEEISEEIVKYSCGGEFGRVIIAEGYLSFVLGIISIIVTFSVLLTYSILEKLRNLPGVCTMNLTLALFLGDLIFITSGDASKQSKMICQAMGVLLHYFFLASFFWMNAMTFDVFRTFANKCILTRIRKKRKYFPRYALYAWGSPAVIVLICAIVDFTKFSPYLNIGYGGISGNTEKETSLLADNKNTTEQNRFAAHEQNLGCWIQEPVAALLAFGLPMFLILFSNALMFIRTIVCIRKTSKLVKFKTRRSSINHVTGKYDVILYVRMSTVMGFTWIFGLASSFVSAFAGSPSFPVCIVLHVLGLCFVIFKCSQGLLIFFAFVMNRRVLTYFKEVFSKIKSSLKQNPISSASTSSIETVYYSYSED